jgi:TP901 family phage tail tape measure protein
VAAGPVARSVTTRLSIDARGWVAGGQVAQRSMRETSRVAQQGAREAIRAFRDQQVAQERAAAAAEKAARRAAREQSTAAKQAARDTARAAREQEAATKRAAAEAERAAAKQRDAYDKVGTAVGGAGLAIVAGLGMAISKSMDFEAAMSGAAAATGLSGKALDALQETAIRAGASTQYSATEAANAITEMGKAGISASDIMGGGLTGALNLAAAGQLAVADAAEIAASMMTQFRLAGSDLPHVADLLAAGAGKAQGSVQDMGLAMSYVGPVAAGLGVSIEETSGAVAELASNGIVGEKAGTGLRGMLMALTAPSEKAAGVMAGLGINLYDAQNHFIGVRGAADQLHRALGPLDEATRNQALGQIFGNEQIVAARIFYEGGGAAVDSWTAKVNDSGFAARQAAKLTDNLRGDIERLGGAFDTALISSGSDANGVLRTMVQQVTGLVDIYNSLPGPVQTAGTAFAAAAGGVGLLGGGLLLAAPRIQATKTALQDMGRVGTVLQRGLSGTAGILGGPWGVALAAGTLALGFWAQKHADAVKQQADLRASLDQTTGAITDQTTAMVAQRLQQDNTLKLFGNLAGGVDVLTQAAMGNAGAMETIRSRQAATREEMQRLVAVNRALTPEESARLDGLGQQQTAYGELYKRLGVVRGELGEQIGKQKELAAATGQGADASGKAGSAASGQAKAQADLNAQLAEAAPVSESTADAMLIIGRNAKATDQDVQELAKSIDKWKDQVIQAYDAATDVIGNFSVKAGDSASQTADKFEKSYRDTVKMARQFANDVQEATRRGLNPDEVATLLEQGPQKAGPILHAMVQDHSGRMIRMANNSRQALANIGDRVAEQARLTNLAVQSSDDKMTSNLGAAMRISQALAKSGGRATAQALARELGIGADRVERISKQFGISIATNTRTGTTRASGYVQDFGGKIKQLPDSHHTTFTTPGLPAATTRVEDLRSKLAAIAKRDHISVSVAVGVANKLSASPKLASPQGDGYGDLTQPARRSGGGPVSGPGGPRDDVIPALLSNREWVHPVDAVDTYGPRFMRAVQTRQFPIELAQAFADGGQVAIRGATTGPASAWGLKDAADALRSAIGVARSSVEGLIGGAAGAGTGMGYQRQMAILRAQFPGITMNSGFRPGAITATGHRSYHSMGRAVDIPPRMEYFNWIRQNYGKSTKELIFSPAGNAQLWHGQPHYYTGVTRSMHFNHVHWAMNRGGQVGTQNRAAYRGGFPGARRFATGGPVLGGDYSGISSIVQARVTVSAQDIASGRSDVAQAERDLAAATKALAESRRKDSKAAADARGAVRTAQAALEAAQASARPQALTARQAAAARARLTAAEAAARRPGLNATQRATARARVASARAAARPQALTARQRASARARVTAATERLEAAERRLAAARRDPNADRAEATLVKRRQELAKATRSLNVEQAAYARQTRPLAVRFHEAATTRNRVTAGFLRNLQTLASRGFGNLARQLSEMGGADAETLAAQAVASTRTARTLQADLTQSARLEAQAATLPARLAITSALRTQRNPTIAGLAQSTGLAATDLQAAALAMRGSLGRNTNARALLSGLGTNTTAGGFGTPAVGGDQIVVQVASTGNPWLDGERALAGAKRVQSVGSTRRF